MKKYILLSMVMLLVLASSVSALTTTIQDIGISDASRVKVSMLNQDPDPVEPGQMVTLRFKAENFGAVDVADVDFRLIEEFPFTIVSPHDAIINLGNLYGRQIDEYAMTLEWKVLVSPEAAEGDANIRLEYIGPTGDWVRLSPFTVEIESHDAIIDVTKIKTTPERVESGNTVEVDVTLKNKADSLLKDIETTLSLPEGFAPVDSTTKKTISQLLAGETKTVSYKVIVDTDIESKVHKFPLELNYHDEVGSKYADNMSVGLIVDNPARYVLNLEETDIRMADNKGRVVVSFSGVGFSDINFVRLSLDESEAFELLSTPLVYLGNVEPDDFQTAEFELFVYKHEGMEDLVELPFVIEYTDEYNREVKKKEVLSFKLYSDEDATKYGYKEAQNKVVPLVGAMVGVLLLVFWLRMLIHAITSKHATGTKLMWIFIIVATLVVGAILYYLFGRRTE